MSYFAQIRIVDDDGNVVQATRSGDIRVKLEGFEEILIELKKLNVHLSEASGMEPTNEDVGG